MTYSLEQRITLVRSNVSGVTLEQAAAIAQMCQDSEALGQNDSVWHNSAKFFGTACNCAKCHPIKGAFKYHTVRA